jgi:hypothetical protein
MVGFHRSKGWRVELPGDLIQPSGFETALGGGGLVSEGKRMFSDGFVRVRGR